MNCSKVVRVLPGEVADLLELNEQRETRPQPCCLNELKYVARDGSEWAAAQSYLI